MCTLAQLNQQGPKPPANGLTAMRRQCRAERWDQCWADHLKQARPPPTALLRCQAQAAPRPSQEKPCDG